MDCVMDRVLDHHTRVASCVLDGLDHHRCVIIHALGHHRCVPSRFLALVSLDCVFYNRESSPAGMELMLWSHVGQIHFSLSSVCAVGGSAHAALRVRCGVVCVL